MHYGICLLSIVPGRKEPQSTSEMVTQLLFGEQYTVIESGDDWAKITMAYDNYTCWISIKQHYKITESTFHQLQKQPTTYLNELIHLVHDKSNNASFPITLGASLPFYKNKVATIGSYEFECTGSILQSNQKKTAIDILLTANLYLNAPYLWGGKTPFGIDCSGFTQQVFKLNGYKLPRDAYQQVELGSPLSFVEEAEAGDLAFFDNEEGKIVHVGILLNNEQIIHASGSVRIDKFDHYGIFSADTKKYSHTLRVIKRVLIG
jgi:gamma-D-glutamyl-L-lysine dipeptidyl-peptidase